MFLLSNPLGTRPYGGVIDLSPDWELPATRGEFQPAKPARVRHAQGGALPGDVIWMLVSLVVTQRFIDILVDHGFTGWSTYPVEVYSKAGDLVPGYHGLSVTGRCGLKDPSLSEVVPKEYPGGWFPVFKGTLFDPASWDGSDFFMESTVPDSPRSGGGFIFTTDDVRKALRKAKISNLMFEKLSEHELPTSNYEISSPHLVPADFARRLAAAYRKAGVPVPDDYQELVRRGSRGR